MSCLPKSSSGWGAHSGATCVPNWRLHGRIWRTTPTLRDVQSPSLTNPEPCLALSRAFTKEEGDSWGDPSRRFNLPPPDDPDFDAAAALALLEAAREGDTGSAEMATGYYWGEPRLREHVEGILKHARAQGDDRLEQLAERFLR